jgi:hypothetical protein
MMWHSRELAGFISLLFGPIFWQVGGRTKKWSDPALPLISLFCISRLGKLSLNTHGGHAEAIDSGGFDRFLLKMMGTTEHPHHVEGNFLFYFVYYGD